MCNPDPDSPQSSWRGGLCERTGPSLYGGSCRIEHQDFPKKKNPQGHFGEFPCSNSSSLLFTQPPAHPGSVCIDLGVCAPTRDCAHPLGTVYTSSRRELRLQAPTRVGCPVTGVCAHPPGSVRTSSRRELRPQAPGRVRIKEGSARTPIAQRRPTIKKGWVEAGNTRIPPGKGNPPTKETPTAKNRRR